MKNTNISILLAVLLTSVTGYVTAESCKKNDKNCHESWHQRHEERIEKHHPERAKHESWHQRHEERIEKHHPERAEKAMSKSKKDAKPCAAKKCDGKKVKPNHEKNKNILRDIVVSPSVLVGERPYTDENTDAAE